MKSRSLSLILALAFVTSACGGAATADSGTTESPETTAASGPTTTQAAAAATTDASPAEATTTTATTQIATGQGVGRSTGMMERHRSPIPAEYAGLTNPIPADEVSLARGAEAYALCSACHGDGGMGDGAAAASIDPAPANIAHTSQMMSDSYLFWRISDGGAQFATVMPAWAEALDEQTIWDLINYIQALGQGTVLPGRGMGGQAFSAEAQAAQQAALLAAGVDQGVISQEESDAFTQAHVLVDARMAELRGTSAGVGVDSLLSVVLEELVAAGDLTQDQADGFASVHDRLSAAGLLP